VKYLVLIPDGSADLPEPSLNGRTPLQAARTPNLDRLVREGETGLVRTVPEGMDPGSDVANLSLFGYDPSRYYTGRAPLEAASLGIELGGGDVAFRCNLVSTKGKAPGEAGVQMKDYSAGHISTEEGRRIVEDFRLTGEYRRHFQPDLDLYPGVGYRHLLVWKGGSDEVTLTPPHDILDREVEDYLPRGEGAERLLKLMRVSASFLEDHPVNRSRRERGLSTADAFWFWGAGRRPALPTLKDTTGLSGAVISAVDLVNGIGVLAGLERISVPGATGYVDTDYGAKAVYALKALEDHDIVFVHIEAPDEAGHQGETELKVRAIESVDAEFLGPVLESRAGEDFRILAAPDHPTPLRMRTHTGDPVPYVISPAPAAEGVRQISFSEDSALRSGVMIKEGHRLLDRLLRGQ
jgi:2,3-bisphosphoglycerate-independent phosphoglycerate mutase